MAIDIQTVINHVGNHKYEFVIEIEEYDLTIQAS